MLPERSTMMIDGLPIGYADLGDPEAPAVVLMSGWCHDHRLFDQLVPELVADHRVLSIDWRGHGVERAPVADFGYNEQASDVLGVLDKLGVDQFLPVSHSHGGWPNVQIAERAGTHRVPGLIVIDWLMTPPSPEFADGLAAIQDPERWIEGRQGLFDVWLNGQEQERVERHLNEEMAGYDFEMWARSCRVIASAYKEFGSPLELFAAMEGRRPVRHLFSQPTEAAYVQAQADFSAQNPWFSYAQLDGPTHFPTLDSAPAVAAQIRGFEATELA